MLEEVFFKGQFIMKFLGEELKRINSEIVPGNDSDADELYEKFSIRPLKIFEDRMTITESYGYRDKNPFLQRQATRNSPYAVRCAVQEYRIPYEGDERLFRLTTSPFPFYPYGRLEEGCFVFRIMEEEQNFLNDIKYQMMLLRMCLEKTRASVDCFNEQLMERILTMTGKA